MARSHESLWLWTGAAFTAIGAALMGIAGGLDAASKMPYSLWTSFPMIIAYIMFGLAAICLGCAVRGAPFPFAVSGLAGPDQIDGVTTPSVAGSSLPPVQDMPRLPSSTPSIGPRPTGSLSSPQDRSKVRHHQVVSGTVAYLSPGAEAWIVVLPTVEGNYWPQFNLSKGRTGDFRTEVWFGGRGKQYTDAEYTLQLVMASPDASARFREFQGKDASRGMPELPAGVELLDQVTVTRR